MRKIEPEMFQFFEDKLKSHGAAQIAIAEKNARNLFIYAAEVCVGIREHGGNNQGRMVRLIQETVGRAEGEAWCMSFVMTCLAYVEQKLGVISPVVPSEHCMTVWNQTPKTMRVKTSPKAGAIVIWRRGEGPAGHTGILTEWKRTTFEAVEGNTESGNAGGVVERDGGGVYQTERNRSGTGSMKVIGFLKPFP